jgi:hypothetical protein
LVSVGYLVALDEFQYFSRKHLSEFTSHLQATVDELSARADTVPGGLIVLGSLHAELVELLDDRAAPLYNRTTDQIELAHLDIGSILTMLDAHAGRDPERLLFLWNLFEGVPKFYRDAYEQGVLASDRKALLAGMFFRSSSPHGCGPSQAGARRARAFEAAGPGSVVTHWLPTGDPLIRHASFLRCRKFVSTPASSTR